MFVKATLRNSKFLKVAFTNLGSRDAEEQVGHPFRRVWLLERVGVEDFQAAAPRLAVGGFGAVPTDSLRSAPGQHRVGGGGETGRRADVGLEDVLPGRQFA